MYTPEKYKPTKIEDIKQFIRDNSFGILLNYSDDKILGTHIPLELDVDRGNDILFGHTSKANPQSKSFRNNDEVLVIYNGPHSYISSSWYEKPDAPTWNYIAVHVYGHIKLIDDRTLMDCLNKLVNKYEKASKNPISLKNMPPKTLSQTKGILGFFIEISEIQATYKLSQDKNDADYKNIIFKLQETNRSNSFEIAKQMKKMRS